MQDRLGNPFNMYANLII